MRQLFVVHGPAYGGGIGQFARLREPMARRGWDLSGIAPAGSHSAQRLREEGLEMHEIELHRLRRTPNPRTQLEFVRGLRAEIAEIRRVIRDNDIDVVQVHGDTNPHGAIAAHLEGRAVVWQLFDTVTPPPARRVTMPFVTRIADVMTTWGRLLGLDYPGTSSLGDRWIPVFPPVDGDTFYAVDPERRAAARARMGVSDDEVVVGQAGNFNPTKGHANLVESVAIVRRDHPELVARIYGAYSPAHPGLKEEVRAKAEALGLDEHVVGLADGGKDIPVLMPGFDVLALSSVRRSEGMPTVILEAMACGLPVVATRVAGPSEIIDDGRTGLLVQPGDAAALAMAIERVLHDSAVARELARAGEAHVRATYTSDRLVDRTAAVFERALA